MNVQELQAAVRNRVDLLVVVLDNQAYGSEYHKLALAGLDVASSEFDDRPFPVCAVAEAMGATARQADSPDQLGAALAELAPMRGVRVVDARIARSPMSEAYQRQHGTADDESSH
jgi:thiamine pyrophosphate-dependent acetolactate synthase large subunit-like protein